MILQWYRLGSDRAISIEVTFDQGYEPITRIIERLIGGELDALPTIPRGRQTVIFDKDAELMEVNINSQASSLCGKTVRGNVVLVEAGVWEKLKDQ